jgi:hypothetical protein
MGMRNKKLLSMAIAASVLLGTTSTAFAAPLDEKIKLMEAAGGTTTIALSANEQQAKISKDKAKEIGITKLKEYLGVEFDETKFQVRVEFRPSYYNTKDDYVWDINWNANDALKSTNIRVSLNANSGKIISMGKNVYSNLDPKQSVPTITQEDAKKASETLIKKVFSENLDELKLMDDSMARYMYGGYQPSNYSFNYQRYKNNVLLDGDFVRVDVDGADGSIVSFESRISENLVLPSTDGVITSGKAEEVFKNKIEMNLMYLPIRNKYEYEYKPESIKLVYSLNDTSYGMIDAKTGNIITGVDGGTQQVETRNLTPEEKAAWLKKVSDPKPAAIEMDSAKAEQAIIERLKEVYGETYKTDYLSYEDSKVNYETGGKKTWRANFYKEVDGKRAEEGGNIVIDALTGEIVTLYKYDGGYRYDEEFTPKLTWSQAYDKAIEAIVKYFPSRFKDLNTEQKNTIYKQIINGKEIPQREYYFNFQRVVNNIAYRNDYVNVVFDAKTGMLRELRCMWTDNVTFPSANGTMTANEAESIYFEKYEPELAYALIQTPQSDGKYSGEYKLAYRLKPVNPLYVGQYIDAFNGKMVNYDGQEIVEQSSEFFNKIKGHKFEKELTILAFQGILDTNSFELDKAVTKQDFIKMIVDAKGYRPYLLKETAALKYANVASGSADYNYLQMAVFYGFLDNKEGDFDFKGNVTRGEMAKVLVKLLGYEKLAKATDIFTLPVVDRNKIANEDLGYFGIAKALEILDIEDSRIRPTDNVTMLELATAIYRVLGNLRSGVYY